MMHMGARFYLPTLGRFLTQDPIGHAGGLNLYAYCDNGPLTRVDPDGKDWLLSPLKMFPNLMTGPVAPDLGAKHARTWPNAHITTSSWILGVGPTERHYAWNSWETQAMLNGNVGKEIMSMIKATGYMPKTGWMTDGVDTEPAALLSFQQPLNGTQLQVGGVSFNAQRKGDIINVRAWNKITFNSLAYHLPSKIGARQEWSRGPMRTVTQHFYWSFRIPK